MTGCPIEMIAGHCGPPVEAEAYQLLLEEAMAGDTTSFAREDYVEEAWRIVDPVLKADTAVHEYEPNTWGPEIVDQTISPPGGWHNPVTGGTSGGPRVAA
jgi:glucose-6-phosphate 1-dehydrogenase